MWMEHLLMKVEEWYLAVEELIRWRVVEGQAFPSPNSREVIIFISFRNIQVHHLTPNSIMHVSAFITL